MAFPVRDKRLPPAEIRRHTVGLLPEHEKEYPVAGLSDVGQGLLVHLGTKRTVAQPDFRDTVLRPARCVRRQVRPHKENGYAALQGNDNITP